MKYVSYLNFTLPAESMHKFEQTKRELVNISSYVTYDMESIMKIKHGNMISPLMVPLSCVEDHLAFQSDGHEEHIWSCLEALGYFH